MGTNLTNVQRPEVPGRSGAVSGLEQARVSGDMHQTMVSWGHMVS